jgi:hypothetical protein
MEVGMNNVTSLEFKDGDDGGEGSVCDVYFRIVENGFVLRISTIDDEWEEVYNLKSELLIRIDEII